MPSVLWRCWLGGRKGIRPVKTEHWGAGVVICLDSGARCRQRIPLPLTVSCFSKIHIGFTFLVPAHPGSPGQRAVKRVRVCLQWQILIDTDIDNRGSRCAVWRCPAGQVSGLPPSRFRFCDRHTARYKPATKRTRREDDDFARTQVVTPSSISRLLQCSDEVTHTSEMQPYFSIATASGAKKMIVFFEEM